MSSMQGQNKTKANFYTLFVYSIGTIPVGIKNSLLGSFLLVYFNPFLLALAFVYDFIRSAK